MQVDLTKSTNSQGALYKLGEYFSLPHFYTVHFFGIAGYMRSIEHQMNTFVLIIGIQNLCRNYLKVFFWTNRFHLNVWTYFQLYHLYLILKILLMNRSHVVFFVFGLNPRLLFPLISLISSGWYLQLTLMFDNWNPFERRWLSCSD